MTEWASRPLGELLELVIDHRGKTPKKMGFDDFDRTGYPVLSAKHVKTDELVNLDSIRFASEQMYKKWMKVEIQEGDIVLTSEAPMGEVFYLDGKTKYVLGQRVFGLRPNKEEIDSLYLVAWLTSQKGRRQLEARASGSTVLGIKQSELLQIEVDLPPMRIQSQIAKQRHDLSRKIELNRKINKTLEEMAQAIFKSWFVDFDPVKARMAAIENGDDPQRAAMRAISGKSDEELDALPREQFDQLAATADLFPSALTDSELGPIPEGWEVKPFSDLVNLDTTSVKPFESPNKIWEHFSIPAFDEGKRPSYEAGEEIKSNKYAVKPGAILVSKLNPHFPRTWWVEPTDYESAICSTEFMQFVPYDVSKRGFIYGLVQSGLFQEGIAQRVTGTTGSRQRAQPKAVVAMPVIVPSGELVAVYSELANSMAAKKESNLEQCDTLAITRDALLPKLLSGEISVGAAEKELEVAA